MCFVAPSGVWVVVNPRMPSQLIRSTKAFGAAGEGTSMGFLARMGPDVSRLML